MGGEDIIIISLYHWVDTTCSLVQAVEHTGIFPLDLDDSIGGDC